MLVSPISTTDKVLMLPLIVDSCKVHGRVHKAVLSTSKCLKRSVIKMQFIIHFTAINNIYIHLINGRWAPQR